MPVQTSNNLPGDSDIYLVNAQNQVVAISAAITVTPTNSIQRWGLTGTTYTITLGVPIFPVNSAGNETPVLRFIAIIETNAASGTVTVGGTNQITGQSAPTYATTVTGSMEWLWDSGISKWVLLAKS